MAIPKSRIISLVSDVLCGSDAVTEEQADELAGEIAEAMVCRFEGVYDDDEDEKITVGLGRDDE